MPCECSHDDAERVHAYVVRLDVAWRIVDESHYGVSAKQCPECGQRWITVFCELIDWRASDDYQHAYAIPVGDSHVEGLVGLSGDELDEAIASLGMAARHVRRVAGDGQPTRTDWHDPVRLILSHD